MLEKLETILFNAFVFSILATIASIVCFVVTKEEWFLSFIPLATLITALLWLATFLVVLWNDD